MFLKVESDKKRNNNYDYVNNFKINYRYAPPIREPGYDAPASVDELYFGTSSKPSSSNYYYQQPLYEDEVSQYAAPIPVYAPLSGE